MADQSPSENSKTKPDPRPVPPSGTALKQRVRIRSLSLTGLYILAVFYTFYLARPFLFPVVLAVLFSYLLAPIVRQLARVKIPPWAGAAIVVTGCLALVIGVLSMVMAPAASWMSKIPYTAMALKEKFRPLQEPVKKIRQASEQISELAEPEEKETDVVVEMKSDRLLDTLMNHTASAAAEGVAVIVLIYFMLAYGSIFLSKTIHVIHRFQDKKRAVEIARKVEYSISRYLLTITFINLALGTIIGILTGLFGLPNPVLWGVVATLANFIPYVGAFAGIIAMTLAALLSYDLPYALVFPAIYFACNALEGNFITPLLLGRSFTLNPVVIVVGLLFWGWMWGIAGMFVTVPLLVILKVFCENIESLQPVDEFLSR